MFLLGVSLHMSWIEIQLGNFGAIVHLFREITKIYILPSLISFFSEGTYYIFAYISIFVGLTSNETKSQLRQGNLSNHQLKVSDCH